MSSLTNALRTTIIISLTCATGLAEAGPDAIPIKGLDQAKAFEELMKCEGTLQYIPVPALQMKEYATLERGGTSAMLQHIPFPTTGTTEVNKLLPNLSMDVSSKEIAADAKSFIFKTDIKHRQIVMDFTKSRIDPIFDSNNKFYAYGRVGAGLRLKIDLWTSDNSFDTSLIGLAASAKGKTAHGSITAETIGLNSSEITLAMPFSTDFSEGSVQKIIEALAVIKSRLHDSSATLVPHLLARIACPSSKHTEETQDTATGKSLAAK